MSTIRTLMVTRPSAGAPQRRATAPAAQRTYTTVTAAIERS